MRFKRASNGEGRSFETLQKELELYDCVLYEMMARILMLDFRFDCLEYQAGNWYHADLDCEALKLLQLEKGLLIIGSICADARIQPSEYPELDVLSMLDAAMKVFLAKRLASK
ncbi:hypothetical protein WN944_023597 [Citrus x changshan-huyou]|uniref:Uncharacterized protein n=1 Tax=Citrus x changshan-huyou TaxID=2935761 RepID=A0AAP0R1C8_9ROSI